MKNKLCKIGKTKYIEKNYEAYLEMVKDGKHLCTKCGRVGKKEYLCKAKEM